MFCLFRRELSSIRSSDLFSKQQPTAEPRPSLASTFKSYGGRLLRSDNSLWPRQLKTDRLDLISKPRSAAEPWPSLASTFKSYGQRLSRSDQSPWTCQISQKFRIKKTTGSTYFWRSGLLLGLGYSWLQLSSHMDHSLWPHQSVRNFELKTNRLSLFSKLPSLSHRWLQLSSHTDGEYRSWNTASGPAKSVRNSVR